MSEINLINLRKEYGLEYEIDKELQWNIYQDCLRLGCCEGCCARFAFLIQGYKTHEESEIDLRHVIQGHFNCEWEVVKNEQPGHCAVCLGVFEEELLQEILQHKGIHLLRSYHSADFRVHYSLPSCLLIREHCMLVYLKGKYGPIFPGGVRSIKHVLFRLLRLKLARLASKTPHARSRITLQLNLRYPLNTQEYNRILKIPGIKHKGLQLGARRIMEILNCASDESTKKCLTVPPKRSLLELTLQDVVCHSETIILRGLFNKYSRLLPQNSQSNRNKTIFKFDTILKTAVHDVLDDDELEVEFKGTRYFLDRSRILGSGGVMHFEIIASKYSLLSEGQLKAIEQHINENPMVSVKDLHQVNKIIDPEQCVIECYKVLCMVFDKDLEECVNCINNLGEFQVTQRLPIRWLSAKKMDSRSITIFKIAAASVPGKTNLLEVCLWIGASKLAFAIPEFIHGDFGRTTPSLSDIVGAKLDMLAIDQIAGETLI